MDDATTAKRAEKMVAGQVTDYTVRYFAAFDLQNLAKDGARVLNESTVKTVETVVSDGRLGDRRQDYFLLREVAGVLREIMAHGQNPALCRSAFSALCRCLGTTSGLAHRAAAEALGGLETGVAGPAVGSELEAAKTPPKSVHIKDLAASMGLKWPAKPVVFGRSLAFALTSGKILVLKMARPHEDPMELTAEGYWMDALKSYETSGDLDGHVPRVLSNGAGYVMKIKGLRLNGKDRFHPDSVGVGFVAQKDYFAYFNRPATGGAAFSGEFCRILKKKRPDAGGAGRTGHFPHRAFALVPQPGPGLAEAGCRSIRMVPGRPVGPVAGKLRPSQPGHVGVAGLRAFHVHPAQAGQCLPPGGVPHFGPFSGGGQPLPVQG